MLLRATHQGTSRVATRKVSSPPSPLELPWMAQMTGAAFQSRAAPPKRPRTPKLLSFMGSQPVAPSTLKESQQQLPSGFGRSSRLLRAEVYLVPAQNPMVDPGAHRRVD